MCLLNGLKNVKIHLKLKYFSDQLLQQSQYSQM